MYTAIVLPNILNFFKWEALAGMDLLHSNLNLSSIYTLEQLLIFCISQGIYLHAPLSHMVLMLLGGVSLTPYAR